MIGQALALCKQHSNTAELKQNQFKTTVKNPHDKMPTHIAQFLYPLLLLLLGIDFHVPVLSPAATPTPFSPFSISTLNLFSTLSFAKACYIAGTDSGTCYQVFETNAGVQTNVFDEGCNPTVEGKATGQCNLFCGEILSEMQTICVPRLDPTFANHTYQNKDAWVKDMFYRIVNERKALEMNETLEDMQIDEYGNEGEVVQRFWNGDAEDPDGLKFIARKGGTEITDCEKSFRRYMCYLNFPRCDDEKNSLIMCRSVCENYMRACQIPQWLHRCGEAKYMYDSTPEKPNQNPNTLKFDMYYRAPFPGAPFRDYEEDDSVDPVRVIPRCTPSVKGDGGGGRFGRGSDEHVLWVGVVSLWCLLMLV